MSEWKEWKLEEIYDFASGLSKSRNEFGFGYEFLSFKDVFNNFFVPDKLTQLANTTEQERKRCSVKKGDVFLTRTSETQEELGMSSVALKDYPNATFNGFTKRLRPKDLSIILPEYAGFYFRSPHFRALVTSMASITTRASLNNGMLSDLTIVIPPMEIQKAIASLLSSLDDKIDLLHQQNKTLEAMAETLFRQWFVEEAKDDWEEVELEYVTTRITDGAHKSPATVEIGLPMASVKDMHDWGIDINSCRKIAEHDFHELVRNDCRPLKNDIVIAKDGSYLKHVFVAHEDLDVVILSSIAIIRPNEIYDPILLSTYLKLDSTRLALENIVTGAVIPRIVLKDFRRFPIPLPPKELQKKALVVIEPLIKKCWYNISHIHTLEKLRDTLLPKLMNGEVKINF